MDDAGHTQEQEAAETRRGFLVRAGKFALYTPPAITLLMYPSQSQAWLQTYTQGGYVPKYKKYRKYKKYKKYKKDD